MNRIRDRLKEIFFNKKIKGDIYISEGKETEITVNDGEIEKIKQADSFGAAIRIFKGDKMGFGYFTEADAGNIESLVEKIESAAYIDGYAGYELPEPAELKPVDIRDGYYFKMGLDEKKKAAIELEKKVKAHDEKIKFSRDTTYADFYSRVSLVNSEGFDAEYEDTYFMARTSAIASGGGAEEVTDGLEGNVVFKEIDTDALAADTAERAVSLLGGSSVKSGRYNLIIPPRAGTELLELVSQLFLASNIRKGKSLLKDYKKGDAIGPGILEICDNSLMDKRVGSYPFDAEGVAGQETTVVKAGKLDTFLYDTVNARYYKTVSTGNCARPDFKSLPDSGTSNFYIKPGTDSKDDVIKKEKGLLVNSMMGLHTVDPVSGNFSLGINGWLMEKGERIQPVKEALITGNIKELLMNITSICGDLKFVFGYGTPTIVIKDVLVSGKG